MSTKTTRKPYAQFMTTLSKHVGQYYIDEIKRTRKTKTHHMEFTKTPKNAESILNPSEKKAPTQNVEDFQFQLFFFPKEMSFSSYKADKRKVYFPLFNLYGRPIDIAEYVAKVFIGTIPGVETYYVALAARILLEVCMSLPEIGTHESIHRDQRGTIVVPVMKETEQYISNFTDESLRIEIEKLLSKKGEEFISSLGSILASVGTDASTRAYFNLAVKEKKVNAYDYETSLMNDSFHMHYVKAGVQNVLTFVTTNKTMLSLDFQAIRGEVTDSIKLLDLPMIALKSRVLMNVYANVPSSTAEPYKRSKNVERVTKSDDLFDEQKEKEFVTVVQYGGPLAGLNSNPARSYLLTYSFPLGYDEDKDSLNEKHESSTVKHATNSSLGIYTSLLKKLVDYCFYETVEKGVTKPSNFELLARRYSEQGGFNVAGDSSDKKYLSFEKVNLTDTNKAILSGLSLAKITTLGQQQVSPADVQHLQSLLTSIKSLALEAMKYNMKQTSPTDWSKMTISEVNQRSSIKEAIEQITNQLKSLLEPHIYMLYNLFSGYKIYAHTNNHVTNQTNQEKMRIEYNGREQGLSRIAAIVTEVKQMQASQQQSQVPVQGLASVVKQPTVNVSNF